MQRVRMGLVGYGAWGSHHARAIAALENAELTAIVECDEESRKRAAAEHPSARMFADHRSMLAATDLDAVDVVLPTHLHTSVGLDVLAAGKHLLMEKPLAADVQQCDQLVAEAQRRQRLLAVGHEFRLSALWGKVKQFIAEGAIGEPLYGLIELWRNPYRLGAQGWRYDIRRVGNWILEEPIHFFDLARWYFEGLGEPASVFAQANGVRPGRPELQDNFTAMLQYPGARYVVVAQTLAGWEHHQVVKITGSKGAIWASWSGAKDRTFEPVSWLKLMRGDEVEEVPVTKMAGEVYELVDEIAAFARTIREGGRLPCSGEDGRWAVAMCMKAQESVDTGRIVAL